MTACIAELPLESRAETNYAPAELTPELYSQLRRIANRHLGNERKNHTLQATALVHEAYLKLSSAGARTYVGEVHFLAVASRVMRQVLVDYARSRSTQKRFGGLMRGLSSTALLEFQDDGGPNLVAILQVDDALAALAADHETASRVIEMRYFGGMTAEESSEALGLSVHVVRHHLRFAQAWLRRKLSS
ncbi:MAG: sigma-70 family RNA polymerase sigma factor [Bryobacterales bacterium]|nr:sigma-70 family RNA polymerase sigma factor [Bryobacterales bacterium]